MSKIQDALNSHGGNFSRPTKFDVFLTYGGIGFNGQTINVLCKSLNIPETTNQPIEMSFKGHKIQYPGRTNQQQQVTMTFYVDEDQSLYHKLKTWANMIDRESVHAVPIGDVSETYGNMIAKALDFREQVTVKQYDFFNVYPTSVSEITFDSTNKDQVLEFTTVFTFSKYNMV